ncbi:nonstructural protein [Microviridae sp.]|nr:nonstructural protein [Microviridae sp.]
MILEIYTVLDTKTSAFSQPYFFFSEPVAKREFTNLVNQDGNQLNKNPEDFRLCYHGQFNDDSGTFNIETTNGNYQVVASMLDFVDHTKQQTIENHVAQLEFQIKSLETQLKNSIKKLELENA